MEAKIKEQVGDRDPEFVFHLILDSTKCQKVEGLDQFNALEVLSMNSCGLTSLQGFPKLPQLKELSIADNKLAGCDLKVLQDAELTQLTRLVLAGNSNVKELSELAPLARYANLKSLDLYECQVTKLKDYRDKVFAELTTLVYLDGTDQDGNEEEDEEEEEDELDELGSDDEGESDEDGSQVGLDEDGFDGEEGDEEEDEDTDDPHGQKRKREGEEEDK